MTFEGLQSSKDLSIGRCWVLGKASNAQLVVGDISNIRQRVHDLVAQLLGLLLRMLLLQRVFAPLDLALVICDLEKRLHSCN